MKQRYLYKTYEDKFGIVEVNDSHDGVGIGIHDKKDKIKTLLEEKTGHKIKFVKIISLKDEAIDLFA